MLPGLRNDSDLSAHVRRSKLVAYNALLIENYPEPSDRNVIGPRNAWTIFQLDYTKGTAMMWRAIVLGSLAMSLSALPAFAQTAAASGLGVELQAVTGRQNSFVEADTCSTTSGSRFVETGQTMAGLGIRLYSGHRAGAGLEVTFMRPCAQQNFTFYQPARSIMGYGILGAHSGRVRPYAIGGVGATRHKQLYRSTNYPETRLTVVGGGGVRIMLPARLAISPEVLVGGNPAAFTRVSLGIGWQIR